MPVSAQRKDHVLKRFADLCKADIEEQVEFFLKSFIFALGNNWKDVLTLSDKFRKYIRDGGENGSDLNPVQAADFLQKYGITRTASQRSAELKDVDLNADNRISFIEYLLLHFKVMILQEYYKRTKEPEEENLSGSAIGLVGVGIKLLDQLFTVPVGLDPEVEKAIEEFTRVKKQRESKISNLQSKSAEGGVKGLAAKNELEQLSREDLTDFNRIELTLNAAKRRSAKSSGEVALQKKKMEEQEQRKAELQSSRDRLAARAAAFEQKSS